MKLVLSVILLAGALCANTSLANDASQTVTWIRWDDPPIFIFSGPFQGQGLLDNTQRILIKNLPQYTHKTTQGSVPEVVQKGKDKSPICNAGWLETPEWSKIFYFSKPVFVIPTNGLLTKHDNLMELKSLVPLSLQKVIDQKPQWTLGVGRLYGEGIDDVLIKNNYKKNPKIKVVDNSLLAHQMLHTGRIQYTLGYPFEAFYYNKLLKSPGSVEYLPLKDNGDFVYVVVACPKIEWGKKVIESVDLVLNSRKVLEDIRHGVDRWLSINDQNGLIEARRKMVEKYYPDLTK